MDVVDLSFPLRGKSFPLDHGYSLYAALCRLLPELHAHHDIGIHPIRGTPAGSGQLRVAQQSELRVRTSTERIGLFLSLAGRQLDLDGCRLRAGVPRVLAIKPASTLAARTVTIKGFMQPAEFLAAARKQLDALGVSGKAQVVIPPIGDGRRNAGQPVRRTLRIKDKTIVGFAMRVSGLTADESLALQQHGLGGRRHMGCGIFNLVRTPS